MVHGSGVAGYETVMIALRMINGCFRELDGECVLLFLWKTESNDSVIRFTTKKNVGKFILMRVLGL